MLNIPWYLLFENNIKCCFIHVGLSKENLDDLATGEIEEFCKTESIEDLIAAQIDVNGFDRNR